MGQESKKLRNLQIASHQEAEFKAVIVDRDPMSGSLLADVLVHSLKCDAIGARSSDLIRVLGTADTDIIIISADLNSKPGSGFDLAHSVFSAYPLIPIVILFDHPTQAATISAFRSGARGVFSRENSKVEFISCIDQVRKGFIWAGAEATGFLLEALRNIPALGAITEENTPALTVREMQVVRSAAKGKSNKAIASEFGLSEHTVKNYLFRAFEKLGVSSRVELLFYLTIRGHAQGASLSEQKKPALK
jgi:DNA-binding NarL/FixJ family response regulator